MSVDRDLNSRDLEAEYACPKSGRGSIPLDARCVDCRRVVVKRVRPDEVDLDPQPDVSDLEVTDVTSFRHICHPCGKVTWWNPVAVLSGLIDLEGGEDDEP